MFENIKIVLASGSPRRKQLLEQAELRFEVKKVQVDESYPEELPVEDVPSFLALKKARATKKICRDDELILAADTIVLLENRILGKPGDKQEAIHMLAELSGRWHQVITGVCLLQGEKERVFSTCTKVHFDELSTTRITHYVEHYHPLDKAGAYGIQEWIGLTGVKGIEGDYFNVVGLPVARVLKEIEKLIAQ